MRACEPDLDGFAEHDGVKVFYEVFGSAHAATVVLLPTWSILPSRFWKAQVPYLARYFRVITIDGRGCGRSDRPVGAAAYTDAQFGGDIVAVMDATSSARATLVSLSCGASFGLHVASSHPDRVDGLLAIGPSCGFDVAQPEREEFTWDGRHQSSEGWAKYNRHYWLEGDYRDFLQFFFAEMFNEPHSSKQIQDCIEWGMQIDPATLVDATAGRLGCVGAVCVSLEPLCALVSCPVLVVHGTEDRIRSSEVGERLAELTGGSLLLIDGGGHGSQGRDPVLINTVIKNFVDRVSGCLPAVRGTWTRAARRPKRALYISSPIGLGHARRDLAIAGELRQLHGDLQIDWLAQSPVTAMLRCAGEVVHPGSAWLASESAHIEDECADHDLHAFQAIRNMDEILVNNFMVFNDVVEAEKYDLVIADEAWDVDYFLHENPELKRFAFAWMTDFVGWLPMPDGGEREAALAADYNLEMLEQRARFRRLRDRSIFVGQPEDIVPDTFGPDMPTIRSWVEREFAFSGYVTGFDIDALGDREALRAELGYRPDEQVCIVTVGGSGVGAHLLHRVIDAVPQARRLVSGLKFVVVAGPRIDPNSLPRCPGVSVVSFVPDLHRHLMACDIAVVQGGLSTCMELTAARRPFIYVPLRHHFEQNFHVRHRLDRYRSGRCLPYEDLTPDSLAAAIAEELTRPVSYLPVERDGARRAAALLAELV